ncbi:MAG: hypothetical protein K9K39_07670 [Desulfohalobiaceae bacterium]|nr:hypothetical protein [Desulfohalobiaceae bacterium]
MNLTASITNAWESFAVTIVAYLPQIIGAIIIAVLGVLLAKLVKRILVKILKKVRFEKITEKAGVDEMLRKGEIESTPSDLIGIFTYWFILILVFIAALDALGLPIVSDMLNSIFLYIPNVIAAIVVLLLGFLFGNLLSSVVRTAAANAEVSSPDALGKVALYAIVIFSGFIALHQLQIAEDLMVAAFIIAFGAASLALALAFGLGGKDLAAEKLKKWSENQKPKQKK